MQRLTICVIWAFQNYVSSEPVESHLLAFNTKSDCDVLRISSEQGSDDKTHTRKSPNLDSAKLALALKLTDPKSFHNKP